MAELKQQQARNEGSADHRWALYSRQLKLLHRISLRRYDDPSELFEAYIEAGMEMFGATTGIVARVRSSDYEIVKVRTSLETLKEAQVFSLGDTYCARVVTEQRTVAYRQVGDLLEMRCHPVYQQFGLESYIGTPVWVNDEVFGTLNFSSEDARSEPFDENDRELIEIMAQSIGRTLELQETRRKEERKLLELNRIKRALDQHAIVTFADRSGTITYANRYCSEISGYRRKELIGANHRILKSDHHPNEFFADLWATISGGHVWRGEICNRKKSGDTYWVDTTIVPMLDRKGNIEEYLSIRTPITGRIRSEQRLKRINGELERFVGIVSHDLRGPVSNISMCAEMLHEVAPQLKNDPSSSEFLSMIESSAKTAIELISDLLDLTSLQEGRISLERKAIKVDSLFEQVRLQLKLRAEKKDLEIVCGGEAGVHIWADGRRIGQVLDNLLTNAIKFTPRGGRIELSAKRDGDYARLCVSDSGVGISPEVVPKLFERHLKISTNGTDGEAGTGFGLPLSAEIVRSHGGRLDVTSGEGQGSTFSVILPLAVDRPSGGQTSPLAFAERYSA
ncbi:MAG: ATP-binding protein [Opitutales bacterium]